MSSRYSPPGFTTVLREKEFWLLVLTGLVYFHKPLFLGDTLFYRDLYSHFLPQKQMFVDLVKAGEPPLWHPYLQGGQPYLANLNNIPLYPSNLFYLIFPLLPTFNWDIVIHVILCGAFTYFFSRKLGLHPVSSLIAGLIYGFCGFMLSLTNNMNRLMAMPYIPLLLLFWHMFLLERKARWFVACVLAGVVQILAGAPDIPATTLVTLLLWSIFYSYRSITFLRKVGLWLLMVLFVSGVASIQIVPLAEMVLDSQRGLGLDYQMFSRWSLNPKRLPEMVVPGFLGYTNTLSPQDYWGRRIDDQQDAIILSIYFGCIALGLAAAGGLHKEQTGCLDMTFRRFLLMVFAASVVLSFGRFLPFFEIFYNYFPLSQLFRFPIKFLTAGILPLSLLAGEASEIYFGKNEVRSGAKLFVLYAVLSFIFLTLTMLFAVSHGFADQFQSFFFEQSGSDWARKSLKASFTHAFAVSLPVALILFFRRKKPAGWQHWTIAMLIVVDLLVAGRKLNPSAPRDFLTDVPDLVPLVRREIRGGNLFLLETKPTVRLKAPTKDMIWWTRWDLETLRGYVASYYRIPVIFHSDLAAINPVALKHYDALIRKLPWEKKIPLLSASAVTLIITNEKNLNIPGVERVTEIPNRSDTLFYLYRNTIAAPRTTFVSTWISFDSDADVLGAMLSRGYDPRKHVVLKNGRSELISKNCGGRVDKLPSTFQTFFYSVENQCDGYLVFSEPYYPGWETLVDGVSVSTLRANSIFSAVFLKAGRHKIERHYRPASIVAGSVSSLTFAVFLALIGWKGWVH